MKTRIHNLIFVSSFKAGLSQDMFSEVCYGATMLIKKSGLANTVAKALSYQGEYREYYVIFLKIVLGTDFNITMSRSFEDIAEMRERIKAELKTENFGNFAQTKEVLDKLWPMAMMYDRTNSAKRRAWL